MLSFLRNALCYDGKAAKQLWSTFEQVFADKNKLKIKQLSFFFLCFYSRVEFYFLELCND